MIVRSSLALSTLTAAGLLALAGPAAAVCDAYSGTCTEPPRVLNETVTPPAQPPASDTAVRGSRVPSAATPTTLPFTGGELVLVSTLGLGALVGGTALVVAGRRRAATTPTA